jgi:hypothetical protein
VPNRKLLPRSRAANALVPPEYFESGNIGGQTAKRDVYFSTPNAEDSTRIVMDNFVNLLPEWKRSAVQMCIMANMTYEKAAEEISMLRGKQTDKKTVWRWARAGVEDLKVWLMKSPWVGAMTNDKIPVDAIDDKKPVSLPWRRSNGS